MISLYVRPQDWVPAILGLPTNDILIPLGLAIGYFSSMRDRESFAVPQLKLFAAYLLIIFVSTYISVDMTTAFDQFVLYLKRVLVFVMILFIVNSRQRVGWAIAGIQVVTLFLAYQAYLQGHEGQSWGGLTPYPGYSDTRVRWFGDWDGPNVYAILFIVAIAMMLELVIGRHSFFMRLVGAFLSLSYMVAIYYTNSRGAYLAVACVILFYFKDRFKSVFAVVIAVVSLIGLFTFGPSRLQEINSGESSAHERTWLWEQGLAMLKENPFVGIGRGQFAKNVDLGLIAHNNYVQNFAETGLLGFFCFMGVLWFTFKGNLVLTRTDIPLEKGFRTAARMMNNALVGYAAATFFVVMELDMLYFVLGVASSVYVAALREHPELERIWISRGDVLVIAAAMAGIIALVWLAAVKEIL